MSRDKKGQAPLYPVYLKKKFRLNNRFYFNFCTKKIINVKNLQSI